MRPGCIKRQMRWITRWLKLKYSWSHKPEVCLLSHGKKLKKKQINYCWESLCYFWLHKAAQLPGAPSPCISCWSMNLFYSSNEAEITLGKQWTHTHLWCQTCFIFMSIGGTCAAWLGSMSLGKVGSVSGLTKLFLGEFFFLFLNYFQLLFLLHFCCCLVNYEKERIAISLGINGGKASFSCSNTKV